ncbi:MAG: DUF2959 family protein [Bernardetiaceae bacterium]
MRNSPNDLPKLKKRFQAQITSFEQQKEQANKRVAGGLEELTALQKAIEDARQVDKEFNRVYGKWEQIDKKVQQLYREYEELKQRADDLFAAIEKQIGELKDAQNKNDLREALRRNRNEYNKTLANTAAAIDKLRGLHNEAIDIIKALEAAVAIGQIAEINEGLKSIQDRVGLIMQELNTTIEESKNLYNNRMGQA